MNKTRKKNYKPLTLGSFVKYCNGRCDASKKTLGLPLHAVWNDSRSVEKGDVFIALQTENDDGHKYVEKAFSLGAISALVSRQKADGYPSAIRKNLIAVSDPLASLQNAAARYRRDLTCAMIGITGSSGKTTARNFIATVLKSKLTVGETRGNWNNHIGVPLSLLRFTGKEDAGVLEMGANHVKEIHDLSKIVRPDIAVITNIGFAHIGYFGSQANILDTKFEIVDGMKSNGLLLLNGDDALLVKKAKTAKQKTVFYGMSEQCDIRATDVVMTKSFRMSFRVDNEKFEIPMPGRHFVYSALAAIAIARQFGIEDRQIRESFSKLEPVSMRGTLQKKAGATFIVDCYNANPSSMKSGISLLCDVAGKRPTVAIVGDMLELGKFSSKLHSALGKQLAEAGVRNVIAVGEYSGLVSKAAHESGIALRNIGCAASSHDAIAVAKKFIRKGDVVLLKGSRGIHLETILEGM